jgi:hypothetical protein
MSALTHEANIAGHVGDVRLQMEGQAFYSAYMRPEFLSGTVEN